MFDPRILCVVLRYREGGGFRAGIISWALELYGRLSHVEPTQDFCVCVSFTFPLSPFTLLLSPYFSLNRALISCGYMHSSI